MFPGTVQPKADISPELQAHLRYPEDLFKVQRSLLTKYHVDDPVKFFTNADFWNVPLDPNPTRAAISRRTTSWPRIWRNNDNSSSFQLTSALNWLQREFLAAYVSASSNPPSYGKITVLTIPGRSRAEAGVQRDQYRHRRDTGPRCDRTRQPEPDPLGQPVDPSGRQRRIALRGTGLRVSEARAMRHLPTRVA